ncbi:uncharacterized protein [Arachis hypogaea]|uniref:uncharacterized protein isoform X4 n=1 Tax=Arachis hypogaea TaxID=3818 RepID=UPI0034E62C08
MTGITGLISILILMYQAFPATSSHTVHYYYQWSYSQKSWYLLLPLSDVCLDGTLPVYHFHPGSGSGANSWLNDLEVMAILADFILVYLPAPTIFFRPPPAINAGPIAKFFHNCPNNAFQVALSGTSYSLLQRLLNH